MTTMVATCKICFKEFTHRSSLSRHRKEKHRSPEDLTVNQFSCVLCDKKFKRREILQTHMNTVHFQGQKLQCHKPKCNFTTFNKQVLAKHMSSHQKQEACSDMNYECNLCPKRYKLKSSLKYHLKKQHLSTNTCFITYKKVCPLCAFTSCNSVAKHTIKIMLKHFSEHHDIKMNYNSLEFESIHEFKKWKNDHENEFNTRYNIIRTGKKNLRFICHRSGIFKKRGCGKRSMKLNGSFKIGGFCPASMTVNISESGKIKVLFQKSHVGHLNDLKSVNLSKADKDTVAASVANKIPYEEILRKIRRDVTGGNLKRIHLMTRKDLVNIAKSYNLGNESLSHPFDPVSVQMWVNQFQFKNKEGILYFKPQGVADLDNHLAKEDFVLIFMTNAQKDILLQYGGDVVCVDGTHGVNAYNFQLYTTLVIDEAREGVPVCFMISNKGDEQTMTLFFKQIRSAVGPITSKVFMSDMDEAFYNSWKKVMGAVNMQIFCTWHVLKAWRKNINIKISRKEKRAETYNILRVLLCETDRAAFDKILKNTICLWKKEEEMKDFVDYFFVYYVANNKFEKWAYCCRIGAGINTNMALENFNKLLKYCYLRGKNVKRLDKTLNAILHLIEDKLFDILIKTFKGKVVSKLRNLRKRHRESLRLDPENVVHDGVCDWKILSSRLSDLYTVKRVNPNCHNCLLRCHHCNSCFHEYTCSCLDHGIKNNMCKHIHIIARLQKQSKLESSINENVSLKAINLQNSVLKEISYNSNRSAKTNFVEEREQFLMNLNTVIREKVTNFDELEAVINQCKPIPHIVNAIKTMPSTSAPVVVDNKPANSSIIQQRKFFSTMKRKRKRGAPTLSCEENNFVAVKLMLDGNSQNEH